MIQTVKELKKQYHIKAELHAHTMPVSRCGHVSPEDTVKAYADIGCDCLVITNHLNPDWLVGDPAERAEEYLDDYYKAKKYGEKTGVKVILGVEIRFTENSNDYLVYGVDASDIIKMIPYLDRGISEFYREFKSEKNLILQAHPFRKNMVLAPIDSIDGIEAFNCHPNHNGKIAVAAKYAMENNFVYTGGSDHHDEGQEGLCLTRLKSLPDDSLELAKMLKSRDYIFDIAGNLVIPYAYD